jgi:septal ring factor EnvC (AmiA/AmiB activator)
MLLAAAPVKAADSEAKREELRRIQQEMQEKQEKLKRADKKERSILSSLERMDRDIQAGAAELADQQRAMRDGEAELARIERSNAEVAVQLERLRPAYAARLRALYKMSRTGGYAVALLSTDSFSAASKRMHALAVIANQDQRLLREYGTALERLAQQEREVLDRKADLLVRKASIESKRASLEVRRRKKGEILSSVKQEKGVYEATLRDLEESSSNLWAMIRLAEPEKKSAPQRAAEQPSASVPSRDRLPWPVNGQVLTGFGSQRHPQFGTVVFRRGIDIAAKVGDEVKAVDAGQVAWADWYKGYGRLVIVDHGAGLYTLYGHLSQVDINKGDRVARGQVIGLAGDTGSLRGPKLYFEIRRNGEAEDPLGWLAKR